MKKTVFILVAVVTAILFSGCGQIGRMEAQVTGYSKQCVDGVIYLQFASGVTTQVKPDGLPVTCK